MHNVADYDAGYAACWGDLVSAKECAELWKRSEKMARRRLEQLHQIHGDAQVKMIGGTWVTTHAFAFIHPPDPVGRPKHKP
jgi:hypothetical protein